MKKYIVLFFLILETIGLLAQNQQVGSWINYLPYHDVIALAEGNGLIYGATKYGLIEYDYKTQSIARFSKVMGLSDVGISCLGYNQETQTFVVGYSNGKIDLLTNHGVVTVSDLYRKIMSGNKTLTNICMDSVFAYISTGFGIVKLNVKRQEFTETYIVSDNGDNIMVNDLTIAKDTIYAATSQGLRKAYKNDPKISYYKTWRQETGLPDVYGNYNIVSSYKDTLYISYPSSTEPDKLYQRKTNKTWQHINNLASSKIQSIESYGEVVIIAHRDQVSTYDKNWNEIDRVFNYGEGTHVDANTAIRGKNNNIIIGDRNYGMIINPRPFWFEIINPESPATAKADEIDILNNQINIAAGLKQNNWTNSYSSDGMLHRTPEGKWTQVTKYNDPGLDGVFDLICIQINPSNPDVVYAGSLGNGLIEFTNNQVTQVFDTANSSLKRSIQHPWVGVTGLAFDSQNNLWMANSANSNVVAMYSNDKEWYSYSFANLFNQQETGDILIDDQGNKWVLLVHEGMGVLVFNDNGTPSDTTDDKSIILNSSTGQGNLPSTDVYSIAKDKDGEIWVGTSTGIAVFYNPSAIFSQETNYDAQQIIVDADGYYQYLLGTETITAIAVDGANRKWIGTKGSGVFLMSPDGTVELHHFTAENSPLLSNFIRTIKINETTGEVFFGTNSGIIAYKGTATGQEALKQSAYAYPNPVPENYFGPIAIKGVPTNCEIRITDIAGNTVFTSLAEGTQAIWDGNDMNGQRVGTGIYLVFAIDLQGKQSQVAKVMFTK